MDIPFFLFSIICIFLSSLIVLFVSFTYISNRISLLGIYHELKSESNPNGESFLKKVVEVSKCNFVLAFPMGFAFYILISQNIPHCDTQIAIFVAIGLSLVTLMIMRILANPCESIQPMICDRDGIHSDDHLCTHKERVLSFFFAMIGGSLLIVLGLFSYYLLQNQSFILPPFSLLDFTIILIFFIFFIIVVSFIGELILYFFKPIQRIP